MPHGHFGTSFAFLSLLGMELWAFKVETANFFISKKFFEGQNWAIFKIFKDFLDCCCEAPWHFFYFFSSQSQCVYPKGYWVKFLTFYQSSCGLGSTLCLGAWGPPPMTLEKCLSLWQLRIKIKLPLIFSQILHFLSFYDGNSQFFPDYLHFICVSDDIVPNLSQNLYNFSLIKDLASYEILICGKS